MSDSPINISEISKAENNLKPYLRTLNHREESTAISFPERKDFSHLNLRRKKYSKCHFPCCSFDYAAATGSAFFGCDFKKCTFLQADMEFVDFFNSEFRDLAIEGAGFNSSSMRRVKFRNVIVTGTSFSQSDFSGADISNVIISESTLEGCTFFDATIQDMSLVGANVDYADFRGGRLSNITISISQLPYIFLTKEDIEAGVFVVKNEDDNDVITYSRIKSLLPDLMAIHSKGGPTFASLNLAFEFGVYDKFQNELEGAMLNTLCAGDFREFKYLAKLASIACRQEILDRSRLAEIYEQVSLAVTMLPDQGIKQQYGIHDGEIRSYLLSRPFENDEFRVSITLNSDSISEAQQIGAAITAGLMNGFHLIGAEIEFGDVSISTFSNAKYAATAKKIRFGWVEYESKSITIEDSGGMPTAAGGGEQRDWYKIISLATAVVAVILGATGPVLPNIDKRAIETIDSNEKELKEIGREFINDIEPDSLRLYGGARLLASIKNNRLTYHDKMPVAQKVDA